MDDVVLACRLVLGFVFARSALGKLGDLSSFAWVIRQHDLIQPRWAIPAAGLIALLEAGTAITLLSGIMADVGVVAAAFLLLLFLAVMIRNTRQPQPLPCYCFGSGDADVNPRRSLARLALLLCSTIVCGLGAIHGSPGMAAWPTLGALIIAGALLVFGTWLMRVPELLQLYRVPTPQATAPPRRISFREAPLEPIRLVRKEE